MATTLENRLRRDARAVLRANEDNLVADRGIRDGGEVEACVLERRLRQGSNAMPSYDRLPDEEARYAVSQSKGNDAYLPALLDSKGRVIAVSRAVHIAHLNQATLYAH